MSKEEQIKFSIVSDFIRRKITRAEAALLLSTTERTVTRLARKIERGGMPGIKHANGKFQDICRLNFQEAIFS